MYSNYLYPYTEGQKAFQTNNGRFYPDSTLKQIILPLNRNTHEFDLSSYEPLMSNNQISKYDIDMFFKNLYSQVEFFNYKTTIYMRSLYRISILAPIIVFVTSLILHLSLIDDYFPGRSISTMLTALEIVAVLWSIFGNFHISRIHKVTELNTRLRISSLLEKENNASYSSKGIHWSIPAEHFNWVELRFDYKNSQENDKFFQARHEKIYSELALLKFFLNERDGTYDYRFFTAGMADNCLGKSEVEVFMIKIGEVAQGDLKKLRMKRKYLIGIVIALALGFIALFWKDSPKDTSDASLAYIESFILILYFAMLGLVFFRGRDYFKKVQEDVRDKIEIEVEQENAGIVDKGCRWHLPADGIEWLELWLDYRFMNDDVEVIKPKVEKEDLHKYRFREDMESMPLYRWGRNFNWNFKKPKKVVNEMDYIDLSVHETKDKLTESV